MSKREGTFPGGCDRRCDLCLVSEQRISTDRLISINELRRRIPVDILSHKAEQLRIATANALYQSIADPLVVCAMAASQAGMVLYVADPGQDWGYAIRQSVIASGCCSWSLRETVAEGRFIIKSTQMRHKSLEVALEGQPIYVEKSGLVSTFGLRPTSERRLNDLLQRVIDDAESRGVVPTKREVVKLVAGNPEVWGVSDGSIEVLLKQLKPKAWKEPGRRPKPL